MKTLALAVTLLLMVALLVPAVAKDMPDVPFGHWAYDAVDELTDLGVVEGYPDGTFKGDRTWTRYEFAVMLTRMIDFLEDYLDSKVAGMDMGITESAARAIAREEAQKAAAGVQLPDVQAFMNQVTSTAQSAGAAAAREALAGYKPGISKAEAQAMIDAAVKNFVDKGALDAMAQEFRGELAMLGADVDDLMYRVDALETKFAALEARVTALENKPDKVTGVIEWKAGTNEAEIYDGGILPIEPGPARDFYPNREGWNRFSNLSVKVNIDGKISDKAQGHITLWRPDATYDYMGRGTHIDTAYVDVQDGLFKGVDWRLGKQYFKTGCGLVFDNDLFPSEAAKLSFNLGGLDLTGFFGWTDFSPMEEASEEPTYVGEAKYSLGRLDLDGTYMFRGEGGARRWGIAAGYNGLDVPFFGLKANVKGEWASIVDAIGGGVLPPGISDEAYYARADLMGKGWEPGDWMFTTTWAEQQLGYLALLNSTHPYSIGVLYNGLPWDYMLSDNVTMGQPGMFAYSAGLSGEIANMPINLRWARWSPTGTLLAAISAPAGVDFGIDVYQVTLDKELAEGVMARLTWANFKPSIDSPVPIPYDLEAQYVGGSLNVLF